DIIERSDGIPLFVEEMTKAVLEAEREACKLAGTAKAGDGTAATMCPAAPSLHLRKSSAPDFGALRPRSVKQADNVRRSMLELTPQQRRQRTLEAEATASRQRVPRPRPMSNFASASHQACRVSLAACRRAPVRQRVPSGR